MRKRSMRIASVLVCACVLMAAGMASAAEDAEVVAEKMLNHCGVEGGGLVVHLGCGDGRLTAALCTGRVGVVHGLDFDAEKVAMARRHIKAQGLYGKVSAHHISGRRLPYADNLVNLIVAEDRRAVTMGEMMRVLRPGGEVFVKRDDGWQMRTKPRPKDMDEWTHYLHGPNNNAVSKDRLVGPPRRMQWVGAPRWSRHHDFIASLNGLVSARGRIFYIFDEGSTASIQLPSRWRLVARDAFNGTVLWKRPIEKWHPHYWSLKSGPARLPRRLVAEGNRVYVTLGLQAPLTALDAATGETLRTFDGTKGTEEFVLSDGVLYVVVDEQGTEPFSSDDDLTPVEVRRKARGAKWETKKDTIMAIRAEDGEVLWSTKDAIYPLSLAATDKGAFYFDGKSIVRLDRGNGEPIWRSKKLPAATPLPVWFSPTLVALDDVVLFSGGKNAKWHRGAQNDMQALSMKDGEILWEADHPTSAYDAPEDLLVAGGLVWTAAITKGHDPGTYVGRDPLTGEVQQEFASDDWLHMPHHRCHRAKATEDYLLTSRTGVEFVDLQNQHWIPHHWVRGSCLYGIMPANGLLYAPPHSCACYPEAKLSGFNALAPAGNEPEAAEPAPRLLKGPAFGEVSADALDIDDTRDWPTYRHDSARSGHTPDSVPTTLKSHWVADLGGTLSAPVSAGGRVFVASVDRHTVHCLDLGDGTQVWSFTAGGRVDSPPTVCGGKAIFGCADGWVYCLRASDGTLAWKFRAAPRERLVMSYGQLESAWPVHGSVLVRDGRAYCVAGRSMFLDGGLRLVRLDVDTGQLLSETVMDDRYPGTERNLQHELKWPNLPTALPDVLSCDGRYIYMRGQRFDFTGERPDVQARADYADQKGETAHLFCPTGFLDDQWWHRSYWIYGKTFLGGAGGWWSAAHFAPAGRPLALDDSNVYGFARKNEHYPQTSTMEYHFFATSRKPDIVCSRGKPPAGMPKKRRYGVPPHDQRAGIRNSHPKFEWTDEASFHARALALAGDTLFAAGPPDMVDESRVFQNRLDDETRQLLNRQEAALQGEEGMILCAFSAKDGKRLARYTVESAPAWDGMAAARGRLLLSRKDGSVICLGNTGQ